MAASTRPPFEPLTGHCTCGALTYTLKAPPLITHCCHCTWCQRETGTAFVINAMIEHSNFSFALSAPQTTIPSPFVTHTTATPIPTATPTTPVLTVQPSASGVGSTIVRCPYCLTAVFHFFAQFKASMMFVKCGTLDDASRPRIRPDVHIYVDSKVPWVDLSSEIEKGIPVVNDYYDREKIWSKESLERRKKLMARVEYEGVKDDIY